MNDAPMPIDASVLSPEERAALAAGTLPMSAIEKAMGRQHAIHPDYAQTRPDVLAVVRQQAAQQQQRFEADALARVESETHKKKQAAFLQAAANAPTPPSDALAWMARAMETPTQPAPQAAPVEVPALQVVPHPLAAKLQPVPTAAAAIVERPELGASAVLCPYCGWNHAKPVVEITAEDERNWWRYLSGGQMFVRSMVLRMAGGELKFVYRARSRRIEALIDRQLRHDFDTGRTPRSLVPLVMNSEQLAASATPFAVSLADKAMVDKRIAELTMVASLVWFPGWSASELPAIDSLEAAELYGKPADSKDTVLHYAVETLLDGMSEPVFAIAEQQLRVFDSLCLRLKEVAHTPSFSQKTGT